MLRMAFFIWRYAPSIENVKTSGSPSRGSCLAMMLYQKKDSAAKGKVRGQTERVGSMTSQVLYVQFRRCHISHF